MQHHALEHSTLQFSKSLEGSHSLKGGLQDTHFGANALMSALQLPDLLAKLLPATRQHHKTLAYFLVPGIAGASQIISGLSHLCHRPM